MRKRIKGVKLSRGQGARRALYRSLINALVVNGKIVTTKAKAKFISRGIDKIVNLSKETSVSGKRRLYKILGNKRSASDRLSNVIAPLFSDRRGGYTRIINLPQRRGDSARMARIEWAKEMESNTSIKGAKSIKRKSAKSDSKIEEAKPKRKGILRRIKER